MLYFVLARFVRAWLCNVVTSIEFGVGIVGNGGLVMDLCGYEM